MSEPAVFAIVRDGQQRFYADRWASVYFIRELVWGPEALETWAMTLSELEQWEPDVGSAAVVDFDNRRLVWVHDDEKLQIPKIAATYNRLLSAAWSGYVIEWASSGKQLSEALGIKKDHGTDDEQEHGERSYLESRPGTVLQAATDDQADDDDEDDEDDDQDDDDDRQMPRLSGPTVEAEQDDAEPTKPEEYEFDEDEHRAWVTITDASGPIRHRQLQRLSRDLIQGDPQSLLRLGSLSPCEVPPEEVVLEGLWIEEAERTIGLWGGPATEKILPDLEKGWAGWDVQWAPRGYAQHCAAVGPSGKTLSIEQSLAKILPGILSTQRFSLSTFVSAIGGSLKKNAIKATGCLLVVICSPLLIFGAVSGNWKAVLITVGIVIALSIIAFKVVENKIKRGFKNKMAGVSGADDQSGPPTAGPLETEARRQTLDKLLKAAGLPPLSKVEPLFPPKDELGLP